MHFQTNVGGDREKESIIQQVESYYKGEIKCFQKGTYLKNKNYAKPSLAICNPCLALPTARAWFPEMLDILLK